MKYEVEITETIGQAFEVEAETMEEAEAIARQKYHEGEFVVEGGECALYKSELSICDPETDTWSDGVEI